MAVSKDPKFISQAVASDRWSFAMRTGLDVHAVNTWDPKLLRQPRLLVPIDVQALYIPANSNEKFAKIPLALTGTDTGAPAPTPAPFKALTKRAAGVHLHWAQPDALLNGKLVDDADNPTSLMPLPNRWVVLRIIAPKGASQTKVRGWIVEADKARIFDLDGWSEGAAGGTQLGRSLDPEDLHGGAGGALSWSACYDACVGRFAFHDPLSDLAQATPRGAFNDLAAYVVAGWWSEPKLDPLDKARSSAGLQKILAELNWSVNTLPPDYDQHPAMTAQAAKARAKLGLAERQRVDLVESRTSPKAVEQMAQLGGSELFLPDGSRFITAEFQQHSSTLLHGAVYGVPVKGPVVADQRPSQARVDVAVGAQVEDVLSGFSARGLGETDAAKRRQTERLLTALTNDRIYRLGEPNGAVDIDEFEHDGAFQGLPGDGGSDERIVDRGGPEALRVGRKARTKPGAAEVQALGEQLATDIRWSGRIRGSMPSFQNEIRQVSRTWETTKPADQTARARTVHRPGPRYYMPIEPVVGVRNAKRSLRYRLDHRASTDGTLACRWPSQVATAIGDHISGTDLLGPFATGAVPEEVLRLARSAVAFDPYLGPWIANAAAQASSANETAILARIKAETALRYSKDGVYDGAVPAYRSADKSRISPREAQISDQMRRFSLADGVDPDPVGVTAWSQPWSPLWLEWTVELDISDHLEGWKLGSIDMDSDNAKPGGTRRTISGRSPLNTGGAQTLVNAIKTWIKSEEQRSDTGMGEADTSVEQQLGTIMGNLRQVDIVSASLNGIFENLLGLPANVDGRLQARVDGKIQKIVPEDVPTLLYNGRLRLMRARLIDAFGRVLDLDAGKAIYSAREELQTPSAMQLRPRLTRPTRWMFRLVDPGDQTQHPPQATIDQVQPELMINPVSGYLLPDLIDESLEVFDTDGQPLGQLMNEPISGGVMWEIAPGRAGPADSGPLYGLADRQQPLGRFAAAMVEVDAKARRGLPIRQNKESALSAFLRVVDTTLWTVDVFASLGTPHIAGLVGRPMAVVHATLQLQIKDDLGDLDLSNADKRVARQKAYADLSDRGFPVRLGEMTRDDDGLYGFFVDDDYSRFHVVDKLIASQAFASGPRQGQLGVLGATPQIPGTKAIHNGFIVAEDELVLHPGQILRLTLLMHPSGKVHLTSGIVPRKSLQLTREWTDKGLTTIAPSARIGPVLIDADKVRLPHIASFGKDQNWTRRDTPSSWRDDPILAATQTALLPDNPAQVEEGYVRIAQAKPADKKG